METNNIAKAMAAAFAQIDSAKKAAFNPHLKNEYADLASVVEAIKPALTQHGLFFTQRCESNEEGVTVYTTLFHASGESLDMGSLFLPVLKKDPQGYGSAITYARRYSLLCAFGVPADDDDGEAASVEYKPMPKVAPTLVKAAEEASPKAWTPTGSSGPG